MTANQLPPRVKNIAGTMFGRITVLAFIEIRNNRAVWSCSCSCGSSVNICGVDLRSGNTKSCGCLVVERLVSRSVLHGAAREGRLSGAYRSWRSMKQRCRDHNSNRYDRYGGRGIRVCDRWNDFATFLADMGERPEDCSIERIDVNGDYDPRNCCWLPRSQQMQNQTTTVRWVFDGETVNQAEAARRINVHPSSLVLWRRKPSAMPERLRGRLQAITA